MYVTFPYSWLMLNRGTQSQPTLPPPPPPPLAPINFRPQGDKEVLKCIWCREVFTNVASLSNHVKEAKHGEKDTISNPIKKPADRPSSKSDSNQSKSSTPRKLVRGQDVWLGKGEEQTRQILKCMWCGQSFRSLADLTTHMSETKHYTKVIPQEQLSTWRAQQQQQQSSPSQSSTPSPLSSTTNHQVPRSSPPSLVSLYFR